MPQRLLPALILAATGCSGSLDVFPEKLLDSGDLGFDPANTSETGFSSTSNGTGNGGSGSGSGGSSGSGSSGSGSSGDGSSGSGSSGDGSSGSGSSGDDSSGSGSSGSGSSGSGSSGSGSSGSGSSGSGSSGSGSSGSGSSGSGSSGSGSTGGGTGGVTAGVGRYVLQQAAETMPYYYPCEYVWDVTMAADATYCPGCDFVLYGSFTYDSASSTLAASYCGAASSFGAVLAHDADYLGILPTAMYYDPTYFSWYPLDYYASYTGSSWSWTIGYRDYAYGFFYYYYYTNYGQFSATVY